ncbi:hypothetical protein E2986_12960 [Frieseomelitta varia]|uniref:peptidylprolyl isomerase n=2 Tax=Meliponini TaxID=83319 RepID=A0A833S2Z3_9HYME|nr:hypothetical protein E2986_12960 [Frieseomelitta varia]
MSQQNAHGEPKERKKKESILDLSKYLEKNIRVKFAGGREAAGILKGYDPLLNLVLDNTTEYLRDIDNNGILEKHDFECMALKMTLIEGKGEFSYGRYQENLHIMLSLWEEIAELADFNKDGIVTIEEFKEAVQRSCVGREYRDFPQAMKMFIDSHFKIVDLNDDGVIAADEFRYNCVTRIPVDNVNILDEAYQNLLNSTESQHGLNTIKSELLKPEVVLSEKSRKSFIEKFKASKIPKVDDNGNQAAVLVPLCMHKGELGFLYTLRSTKVTSNRRQVSFPGGMYDKEDRTLEETALRETWEELKIPREKIDVWVSGNVIDKMNVKVLPVFGYIGDVDPKKLQINADEVEEAFFFSLKNLCDLSMCRFTQFRNNYTLPVYLACRNFLKLCKLKYYNWNLFHSVQSNFIAQTGDPTSTGKGGESVYGIVLGEKARYYEAEQMPKIKHDRSGLLSMVNCGNNMLGSQFFITLATELQSLDGEHCVFGEITEGLEIILKFNETICDGDHRPYQDIRISHTVILEDPFEDPKGFILPDQSPPPSKEVLMSDRIGADEVIDDTAGMTAEEIVEMQRDKEAKARATILEIVGDIPDADMAPPENVLFVCKLNPVTTDDDLEIIFSRFGKIIGCEVIRDRQTGDSLQYAFIEFADHKSCEEAYFKMDNVLIDDRRIHVDFSQSVAKMRWKGKGKGIQYFDDKGNEIKNMNQRIRHEEEILEHRKHERRKNAVKDDAKYVYNGDKYVEKEKYKTEKRKEKEK